MNAVGKTYPVNSGKQALNLKDRGKPISELFQINAPPLPSPLKGKAL